MACRPQGDAATADAMRKMCYHHEDQKRDLNDRIRIAELKVSVADGAIKKDHLFFNER